MLTGELEQFSKRYGYLSNEADITIRDDAPYFLRRYIIREAEQLGVSINSLLDIVCDILYETPQGNWGYDYIVREIYDHINHCDWFKIYDIAEAIYSYLERKVANNNHELYASKFNELCFQKGVGWHFQNGHIVVRETEIAEKINKMGLNQLDDKKFPTAKKELCEAHKDISRRPAPDLTGCVQHAVAALECVARTVSREKKTLGELIKKCPELFPKPLDTAVEKIWGYASENGRHVNENREPTFREAFLIMGLATSLTVYLSDPIIQKQLEDDIPF